MNYLWAFLIGGVLCAVGQLFIDLTKLTPARILTGYVVAGVVLSAVGLYAPLAEFAGAGASVPLLGFGHLLAQGVVGAVERHGLLGALTGAIITERVYVVPGAGNLLTKAINNYDNGVIVGMTLFYATLSVISIILGDVVMSLVDPRISFSSKAR